MLERANIITELNVWQLVGLVPDGSLPDPIDVLEAKLAGLSVADTGEANVDE